MSFSLKHKRWYEICRYEDGRVLSILFFMSFSLKRIPRSLAFVSILVKLSILFFMSFSLKPNSLKSQLKGYSKALNPLFHELFSETNHLHHPRLLRKIYSQSSFSWAFLWNGSLSFLERGGLLRLSILFFMSFSLKRTIEYNMIPPGSAMTLNPLFHELFSETNAFRRTPNSWAITALNPLFHELFSETLLPWLQ